MHELVVAGLWLSARSRSLDSWIQMGTKTSSPLSPTITPSNMLIAMGTVFLLNAGFVVVAHAIGAPRPWVNLDYAVALVLFAFGFPALGAVLGLAFLLSDTLVLVGQIFPFPRISDLFYLLKFSALASASHQVLIFGVVVLVAAKLAGLLVAGRRVKPMSALIVLNVLVATTYLLAQFRDDGGLATKYWRVQTPAVASQVSSLLSMRSSLFLDFFEHEGDAFKPGPVGASAAWDAEVVSKHHDRLLLLVIESWGVPLNQEIERALLSPLRQVPAAAFDTGHTKFAGFTIGGELRELCRLTPLHFNLRDVETGFENCLPKRLQAAGYTTAAIHGATSMMYDRRHWYPRAGFDEMTFFEDRVWPRRCYSFPGACDLDMLPELDNFFSQPGKRFMYWLTLNTHAPYDARDLRADHFDCMAYEIGENTETCRLLKLKADFFAGLAQQLRSDAMKDVEVIIVGDHAPKMMDIEEKAANFTMDSVPWVRFRTQGRGT